MTSTDAPTLPPGMQVIERGWLSANNIVFAAAPDDGEGEGAGAAVVDTGYVSHASETVRLVGQALRGQPLARILNTHLHSDHCGGNAALQAHFAGVQTLIPPGQAELVRRWDADALGYGPTGQDCPRFVFDGLLCPGTCVRLGGRDWHIHAAPGHDPHSVILYDPVSRTLLSADALWENGFGVVFPELDGVAAFEEVAATLDIIEQLQPHTVVPGHGHPFCSVQAALDTARRRLDGFVRAPERHALYAAKVLLKYKLLDWQRVHGEALLGWLRATPYFALLHQRYFAAHSAQDWAHSLLDALVASRAAERQGEWVVNL